MASLKEILGTAYREMVLNHSYPTQALALFKAASANPAIVEEAKHRIARSQAIDPKKCFITGKETEFLKLALDEASAPDPEPSTIHAPEGSPLAAFLARKSKPEPRDHEDMTSKLSTLADLAKTTIAEVEADAEAEVTKLLAAKTRANAAVANVGTIRTGMESGAKELEDFANQLTNGGPPLGS